MGNRIYTAASCTFGTHIDEAMERALRRNRFKNMEFDAGIVHYKKDERADQTIARMQNLVKDGAIVLTSNHLPWPAELNISSYEEADRAAACENTRKLILKLEEMGLGSPAYTFHGGTEPTTDGERAHPNPPPTGNGRTVWRRPASPLPSLLPSLPNATHR